MAALRLSLVSFAPALAALAIGAAPAAAQTTGEETGEFTAHGFDVVRIENEYKLALPREQTEEVWAYLQQRYAAGSPIFDELGAGYTAKFSDEQFQDRYFDDPQLSLLAAESGIRHRKRINLGDASDRKSGRELVQVKLRRPGEATSRSEIKFPVKHYLAASKPMDTHPVIGLVDRDERSKFVETVASYGFSTLDLQPVLTLDQRRRRVYVSKDGAPYSTITLDEVSSEKWGERIEFTEIEMELNEIAYTEADAGGQAAMQAVNDRMKADLMGAFPRIVQDQTPKYNKAFRAFEKRFEMFPLALRVGMPVGRLALLAGLGALGFAALVFLTRRPKKRRPAHSAA